MSSCRQWNIGSDVSSSANIHPIAQISLKEKEKKNKNKKQERENKKEKGKEKRKRRKIKCFFPKENAFLI